MTARVQTTPWFRGDLSADERDALQAAAKALTPAHYFYMSAARPRGPFSVRVSNGQASSNLDGYHSAFEAGMAGFKLAAEGDQMREKGEK